MAIRRVDTRVKNKWDAADLKRLIQLHSVQALGLAMQAAKLELVKRLDRGENSEGGKETYKSDYFKDAARRGVLRGRTKGAAQAKGTKNTKKVSNKTAGGNYKGKPVDWLLTGDMRRGFFIEPAARKGNQTEVTLTVKGSNSNGEANSDILKYNIRRRPKMWALGRKEFQKAIEAIRKYFKTAAL